MSPQVEAHFGERIGRYQVLAQLSVGGMAELFLGFTSGPGGFRKYVALKRVLPDARGDEQFERMFLDEARITAALNHPNIGQVFELGQDEGGLYLAMEFIAGQNLNQVTRVCRRRGVGLPWGFSLSVVRDVCLALHFAHTFTPPGERPSPVIHRDVAQKNVMVTYDGVVKLLDFGIAKARGGVSRTQVGAVKGTSGYMSPEQVRGDELDARSDLFSVGVMLHELLTGERLFVGATEHEELVKILEAPIPEPVARVPGLPREVSAVVMKALAREREERYASARELARALESAAGGQLFDAERRAAFMREHFAERMELTSRLLGSADHQAVTGVDVGTARMLGGGDGGAEEAGPTREKQQATHVPSRPRVVPRKSPAPKPVEAVARAEEPAKEGGPGRSWVLLLGLLVVGGLLGFGAMRLLPVFTQEEGPPQALMVGDPSPITPIARPGEQKADEEPASAAVESETAPPTDTQEKEQRAPARRQGALTLVILPEAEVFLNGRSLGKTPLFKKPVPVGKHLLRIKGPDGKRRVLSVPIEANETAQFRLALEDIPER